MKTPLRLLALLGLLAVLAGCVRLDMDLSIGTDDTLDGAIVIAFDKKALGPFVSEKDLLAQVVKQNPLGARPAHGAVTVEKYDEDGMAGRRYRYTGVPLADVSSGALQFRHEGHRYVLTGSLDLTARGDARVNIGTLTDTASAVVRLTFPGRVHTANGAIAGRSVTWKPSFGKVNALTADADDGRPAAAPPRPGAAEPRGTPGWLLVALGALCGAAVAVVLWLVRRSAARRRAASPTGPHGVAGSPGAYPAGAGLRATGGRGGVGVPPGGAFGEVDMLASGGVGVPPSGVSGGGGSGQGAEEPPRNATLPLPVLESPDSLVRDPRWAEQTPADPWSSGQRDPTS